MPQVSHVDSCTRVPETNKEWTRGFEVPNPEVDDNVNEEDVKFKDGKWKLKCGRAQTTQDQSKEFAFNVQAQTLIDKEMK